MTKFGERGFTLIELMVTVAIIALIAAIAAPAMSGLLRSNRVTAAGNEMVALLQTARMAAVSKRDTVTVCPSADGITCAASLGSRWIARSAKSNATLRDTTLQNGITISSSANLSGASNTFTFTPNGFSAAGTNASGTVGVCSADLGGTNDIDVSASVGRISTARRAATSACTAPTDN